MSKLDPDAPFEPQPVARHEVVRGRDALAEVSRKGFLLPIGANCSMVQVTSRTLEQMSQGARAVLQRSVYLRINRSSTFLDLASDAKINGRTAGGLLLLTKQTPQLLDPESDRTSPSETFFAVGAAGLVTFIDPDDLRGGREPLPGLVFWPRTTPDVNYCFKLLAEGSDDRIDAPLLFVDTVAAENPATLRTVRQYLFNNE